MTPTVPTTTPTAGPVAPPFDRRWSVGLWIAQGSLALTFAGGGIWKLVTPIEQQAEVFPWAAEVSPALVHATAVFDLAGGIGVLAPSLTRIRPGLAVAAALGCVALQGSAIAFHASRGEGSDTGVNVAFAALALFVAWGRRSKAPLPPSALTVCGGPVRPGRPRIRPRGAR